MRFCCGWGRACSRWRRWGGGCRWGRGRGGGRGAGRGLRGRGRGAGGGGAVWGGVVRAGSGGGGMGGVFPRGGWEAASTLRFLEGDLSIEFALHGRRAVESVRVEVRGAGDPVTPLMALATGNGWVVLDGSTSELIDPAR